MPKVQALSITTRGIGFATCYLSYIAMTLKIDPPVYEMYRLFLGLAEAKLRYPYFLEYPKHDHVYMCKVKPPIPVVVPQPIYLIINAITQIEHNGKIYMPVVAAQVRDNEGRLIPRPENLLLSNLREVVVALSSPDTPAAYRAAFKANCPIPFAIWDDDLLANADEIIPDGYNVDEDFSREMWSVIRLKRLEQSYPLMSGGLLLMKPALGAKVSKAALVTSRMGDLRAMPREVGETIEQCCRRGYPINMASNDFYALGKISEVDRLFGQFALLGEQPNEELLGALAGPVMSVHKLRQRYCDDTFLVTGNYFRSSMEIQNALLSPGEPAMPSGDEPAMAARPNGRNGRGRGSGNRRRNYQ